MPLVLSVIASGCIFEFDRNYDPRDGGSGADASADASTDAGDSCEGRADGTPCAGGRCSLGVCCTGCLTPEGCRAGTTIEECGGAGSVCRRCTDEAPICGEGRCRVVHPIAELALGAGHRCARDLDGRMYCWGDDDAGQLGVRPADGTCASADPIEVPLPGPVARISARSNGTCATLEDGRGYCWGAGFAGDGTTSPPSTCLVSGVATPRTDPASIDPVRVVPDETPFEWLTVAAASNARFGLNAAGRPFFWGQYGTGMPIAQPTRVRGADVSFVELAAHSQYALGRTADDRVFRWGRGTEAIPADPLATDVVTLGASLDHWCVGHRDGRIECGGPYVPTEWDMGPAGGRLAPRPDSGRVTSIAATWLAAPLQVCWTNDANELWCSSSAEPIRLRTESAFVSVAIGLYHFGALDTGGRAWIWHTAGISSPALVVLP
jgi:hypothetical protein